MNNVCPTCGTVVNEESFYDIGSGPEYCCPTCEWCWGAQGQDLKPLPVQEILENIKSKRYEDDPYEQW